MKALVLFSGGLDSTTCLALAVKNHGAENVIALSVSYGQKHLKEIEAARQVANYYKVRLIELDLQEIFKDSECTLLKGREDIPHEEYYKQLEKTRGEAVSTYVPFRNGLFLSSAAAIALSNSCEVIYYGIHTDDSALNAYPDTSPAFHKAMTEAIYLGSGNKVKIIAPFVNLSKKDVVKCGLDLKVPYELTWSCYEGKDISCGVCGTCLDRKKAFALNHTKDPLQYEVD